MRWNASACTFTSPPRTRQSLTTRVMHGRAVCSSCRAWGCARAPQRHGPRGAPAAMTEADYNLTLPVVELDAERPYGPSACEVLFSNDSYIRCRVAPSRAAGLAHVRVLVHGSGYALVRAADDGGGEGGAAEAAHALVMVACEFTTTNIVSPRRAGAHAGGLTLWRGVASGERDRLQLVALTHARCSESRRGRGRAHAVRGPRECPTACRGAGL